MSANPLPAAGPIKRLPRLREDLELHNGNRDAGSGGWLIYDPLRHKYIQIDRATFVVLSVWRNHTTAEGLAKAVSENSGIALDHAEIDKLSGFLEANSLTDGGATADWRQQVAASKRGRHSPVMWLVHNYLFFKFPLVAPEAFLRATSPVVAQLYRRRVQSALLFLGLIGLYLVSREWDQFLLEARGLSTLSGIASFAVVLFVVKAFHELGHAYTAVRYGCRVPAIGFAFMLLTPMLYTDVTDAWRLTDRKKRLAIDVAGVAVELGLACIATIFWVFLPDGPLRHIAFLIATTSWTMSLAINLNPFMRFDGYYIFSDLLRVENLQTRAFALGIWNLRKTLFALKAPCPEIMPDKMRRLLIAYAYGIWIYRLVLFTGIALVVYAYFFKALGVVLFLFEIGYFIARPLAAELLQWWKMRKDIIGSRRSQWTFAGVATLALLALVPWSAQVQIPAILEGNNLARVFPARSARIASIQVRVGQHVAQGDVLMTLDAPDIAQDRAVAKARLDAVELRLARQSADDEDRSSKQVLEGDRAALRMQISGLAKIASELNVRAPLTGTVVELNPTLRQGQWIAAKEQIALVDGSSGTRAVGYVSEDILWRIEPGTSGSFMPDVPLASPADVTLSQVATTGSAIIDIPELTVLYGGRIEAHADEHQRVVPAAAQYQVMLKAKSSVTLPSSTLRGTVRLTARPESIFTGVWRRVLKVLVRESGA